MNKWEEKREGRPPFPVFAVCLCAGNGHPKQPHGHDAFGCSQTFFLECVSLGPVYIMFPRCPVCGGDFKCIPFPLSVAPRPGATDLLYSSTPTSAPSARRGSLSALLTAHRACLTAPASSLMSELARTTFPFSFPAPASGHAAETAALQPVGGAAETGGGEREALWESFVLCSLYLVIIDTGRILSRELLALMCVLLK